MGLKCYILIMTLLLHCVQAGAAFPVVSDTPTTSLSPLPTAELRDITVAEQTEDTAQPKRNYTTALALCAVFGLLGIHRLYLRCYWQGFLQMFITLGFVTAILALSPSLALGLTLLILTALPMIGTIFWVLIDFVRILQKTLLPKGGEYN
jgi:TM2 domain-containing membrane protein YozV